VLAASASAATEQTSLFSIADGSRARAITAGPDGNLWFVAVKRFWVTDESIGRLTPSGEVIEFPLPDRNYEAKMGPAIVAGPDGNLWFVEYGGKKLGRISLGGEITEFPLPGTDSRASAIASGPDGALWFTEEAESKIGRLQGTITEFPLPPSTGPAGIAAGPDGNIWFTEKIANKIGRITPNGSVTEFAVPTPSSLPNAIAVGPDGALWFTEEGASQVARITPTGEITEFPVPVPTGTEAIVAGPDGDIWFTSNVYLGSITPSGRVADPYCLERGCRLPVASLAVGPEGDLWFGGGVWITEGGGGTALLGANAPGIVGKFVPPPLNITIGLNARSVANRRTDLRVSCSGGAAGAQCSGVLRLARRVRVRGSGSRRMREVVMAHHRYELFTGESRRIPLRLTWLATKMLPRHGPLSVLAIAKAQGHNEAVQSTTLSRRHRSDRARS
jgi:virginiamycin B lyase